MDISEMFAPLVMDVLRGMVQNGAKANEDNNELGAMRLIVREQLRREMRYNAALLNEQQLDPNIRVLNLEKEALEFVFGQAVPLNMLLNRSVSESNLRTAAGSSQKHTALLLELNSEAKLVESIRRRIKIITVKAQYNIGLGDVAYLRKLIVAAQLALSEE